MSVLLITRLLRLMGRLSIVNRFNHTSEVTAVTTTDRPKSVRNRCVIEVFDSVFNVVTLLFKFFSVGVGAFVIGLVQISSLFSCYHKHSRKTSPNKSICFSSGQQTFRNLWMTIAYDKAFDALIGNERRKCKASACRARHWMKGFQFHCPFHRSDWNGFCPAFPDFLYTYLEMITITIFDSHIH